MSVTTQDTMNVAEIGEAAGEVYRYLERNGEVTLAQLKKGIPGSGDLAAMALGWLAREGKIRFVQSGRVKKVALVL